MRAWTAERVAAAAGGRLVRSAADGPLRAEIDSRAVGRGDLFVGLPGERVDGGTFAAAVLEAGAWGVLVAARARHAQTCRATGAVIAADDPLLALQRLATAWRRELACPVVGVTGSVGKTSTKDILAAMLGQQLRTVANRENRNTEIGLPLTVLEAPPGTEALVLEMGMRGPGQIAELAQIAEPDVAVITTVAPVHLELMGSIEAIAAAKAELVAGLAPGGTAVIPAGETLLDPHRRDDVTHVTFGPGGDVDALPDGLTVPFTSAHMLRNALAALAAARAVGVEPAGALEVALSSLRGQRIELAGRGHCHRRLLQRQPDVDARRPRRSCRVRVRAPRGRARRHARARPAGGSLPRRDGRAGPRRRRRAARHGRPARGAHGRRLRRRRRRPPRRGGRGRRAAGPRRAGRHRARQGLARRRPRGRRARDRRYALMGEILIGGTAALLICVFLSPKFIEFLRTREFGQHIREEGPEGHHVKAGTPTMGGIIIFTAVSLPFLLLANYDWRAVGVYGAAMLCALLGFADDYTKIVKRRSLGLRARTKLGMTILISLGLWWVATQKAGLPETLRLRTIDATVDLGVFYPLLIYLVVAGTTSAVNLTDGLDGLAAGCAAIVLLAYIGITFITTGQEDLALLAGCLVGACVGFLWFNAFPATIFMGDTGSLGLGGAVAGLAVMTKTEELLIVLGGIFVIEALSVLIQVFSFQTFRKRVFLMAPVHHHFEISGWSETKIILRFWIVAAVAAAIGFTIFQQSVR